jgi:hypothetical protein
MMSEFSQLVVSKATFEILAFSNMICPGLIPQLQPINRLGYRFTFWRGLRGANHFGTIVSDRARPELCYVLVPCPVGFRLKCRIISIIMGTALMPILPRPEVR